MKMNKIQIDICNDFIEKIKAYCDKQKDFYFNIAQNGDHSEDFIYRMTDLASAFQNVCQFIEICAVSVFDELQSDDTLGDPNYMLGQVEPTATESQVTKDKH